MTPTVTTAKDLVHSLPDGAAAAYDVTVIGAGVVGTALARELARYPIRTALVDGSDDIGNGTSKANTAILHTGFDAVPGSLEGRLVREGQRRLAAYAAATGIPVERVGALLVAWDEEQLAALPGLLAKAERNDYHAARIIDAEELRAREPHLGPGALGALEIPDESIICPWTTPSHTPPRPSAPEFICTSTAGSSRSTAARTSTPSPPPADRCAPATSSTPPDCTQTNSTGNWATTPSPSPRAAASSSSSTSSPAHWSTTSCCPCPPRRARASWCHRPSSATSCSDPPPRSWTTRPPRDPAPKGSPSCARRAAGSCPN